MPVAATTFMITNTWMAARIDLVTGGTLFAATRKKYGQTVAKVSGIFGYLTIIGIIINYLQTVLSEIGSSLLG